MHGGLSSRFRESRINHNDLRAVTIASDSFPENRMCDTGVGTNEDKNVGFFEVHVAERWSIKTE